jgi:hypothetical protein
MIVSTFHAALFFVMLVCDIKQTICSVYPTLTLVNFLFVGISLKVEFIT